MSKKICRTCLKMTYKTYKTHENINFPGETEQQKISDMLRYLIPELYLGVTVNPEVCADCRKFLRIAYAFRKQCMATENVIGCYLKKSRCTASTIELIDVALFWEQKRKEDRLKNNNVSTPDKAKEIISDWDDDASQDLEQLNISNKKEKTQIPLKKEKELILCPELGVFVDKFGNYYNADGISISDPEAIVNTDADFLKITEVFSLTEVAEKPTAKPTADNKNEQSTSSDKDNKVFRIRVIPEAKNSFDEPRISLLAEPKTDLLEPRPPKNIKRRRRINEAKDRAEVGPVAKPSLSNTPEISKEPAPPLLPIIVDVRSESESVELCSPFVTSDGLSENAVEPTTQGTNVVKEEPMERDSHDDSHDDEETLTGSETNSNLDSLQGIIDNVPEDTYVDVPEFVHISNFSMKDLDELRKKQEPKPSFQPNTQIPQFSPSSGNSLVTKKVFSKAKNASVPTTTSVTLNSGQAVINKTSGRLKYSNLKRNLESARLKDRQSGAAKKVLSKRFVKLKTSSCESKPSTYSSSEVDLENKNSIIDSESCSDDVDELETKITVDDNILENSNIQYPLEDIKYNDIPHSSKTFIDQSLNTDTKQFLSTQNINMCDIKTDDCPVSDRSVGNAQNVMEKVQPETIKNPIDMVLSKSFGEVKTSSSESKPSTSYSSSEVNLENKNNSIIDSESYSDDVDQLETKKEKFLFKKAKRERPVICPICVNDISGHFTRHLLRHHADNKDVMKLASLKPGSKERSQLVASMRKEGYFLVKIKRDVFCPVKSSANPDVEYFICQFCLGQYSKKLLSKHVKKCSKKPKHISMKNCLSKSQTFMVSMASTNQESHSTSSRLKDEVFSIMRPDSISFIAKSDPLICRFGEMLLTKYTAKSQMVRLVSNKMREMARLLMTLKTLNMGIDCLFDALAPNMFPNLILSTRIISGFDAETRTYKSPSIALNMGTNLRIVCDVTCKIIIEGKTVASIKCKNKEQKIKEIKKLRSFITERWCNEMSPNPTLKNVQENQLETIDIKSLYDYLNNCVDEAVAKLFNESDINANYKILTECVLTFIVMFNRNRIDDVQYLKLEDCTSNALSTVHERLFKPLTDVEKLLINNFTKIPINDAKPILLSKRIQKLIEYLIEFRNKHEIVPNSNPYLFAYPRSETTSMNGPYIIRSLVKKSGVSYSSFLTSMKFRKHVATTLQLMSLDGDEEMEQIAKFLGCEHTNSEFIRVPHDIFQASKLAKILLLFEKGKGDQFQGRNLNDISFRKDVYYSSDSEFDDEIENGSVKRDNIRLSTLAKKKGVKIENRIKKGTGIQIRRRWTENDRNIVLTYFQKHIEKKTVPKKRECEKLIALHTNIFSDTDWTRVKALVYNTFKLNHT